MCHCPWSEWVNFLFVLPQPSALPAVAAGCLWKMASLSPSTSGLSPSCNTSNPQCLGSSIFDFLDELVDLIEGLRLLSHLLRDFLHCVYGCRVISASEHAGNVWVAQLGQLSEHVH